MTYNDSDIYVQSSAFAQEVGAANGATVRQGTLPTVVHDFITADDSGVVAAQAYSEQTQRHQVGRGVVDAYARSIIVPVVGASGGIGTSTFVLLLAHWLARNGRSVAVVDADFVKGGIDILAGCEEVEGVRWHNIHAPLGTVDAHALREDLTTWDGIPMLACHPWSKCDPQTYTWWQAKAVLEALMSSVAIILIDCGGQCDDAISRACHSIEQPFVCQPIVVCELSTMGVVRALSAIGDIQECMGLSHARLKDLILIASGITQDKRGLVDVTDAEQFLGYDICDYFRHSRLIKRYMQSGFGVPKLGALCEGFLSNVVSRIESQ